MGVTGVRSEVDDHARDLVARLREAGAEHACVGLGVSNRDQAAEVAEYADGVIVGSALVRALDSEGGPGLGRLASAPAEGCAGAAARHGSHSPSSGSVSRYG